MTQTQRQGAAVADIVTIPTPSLGDRSYLVTDGAVAFVVDPQRDIDRVLALTASRGIAVTHVFETHIHNDYVTGGLALARTTGAAYHVNAADAVAFDRDPVADGDVVPVGRSMRVRVIATPGHTFTHLAYVLADGTGDPVAVFTGGSLLFGSTGRTDLLGAAHAAELARAQHASAARLAGVRVQWIKLVTFAISGGAAGLGGIIDASRVLSASSQNGGTALTFTVLAGIVVGGTSILGGEGAIWRTVIGVLFIAIIGNGFTLLAWNPLYEQITLGVSLLLAVGGDAWSRLRTT